MKLKFGWWYVQYVFAFEPMSAFGIFEDEYKKRFDCDEISTLEMVDIYHNACSNNELPSGFLANLISAIAYFIFKIRLQLHRIKVKATPF